MRFPPVRYCQISSAIAETALYFAFWRRYGQKRERGSIRQASSAGSSSAWLRKSCFDLILLADQNNSPGQLKYSLLHDQLPPPLKKKVDFATGCTASGVPPPCVRAQHSNFGSHRPKRGRSSAWSRKRLGVVRKMNVVRACKPAS